MFATATFFIGVALMFGSIPGIKNCMSRLEDPAIHSDFSPALRATADLLIVVAIFLLGLCLVLPVLVP